MDNKQVLFVEPAGVKSNVFTKFMTIPLLGPVYLATIAKNAGYDVSIFNENILGRKISSKELEGIDILCLSCLTPTVNRGKEIAKEYRSVRKNNNLESKVIIGGIHASMLPHDVAPYADCVVVGEAENVILDVLSGKTKDKIVYAQRPTDLDSFPLPDFKLIKGWENIKSWPAMTSRGCPYDCNFCSVTEMFGRNYRTQSPERVMKEILRYNKGDVFFSDDHFVANTERTNKILDLMKEYKFKRRWSAQVRTELTKNPKLVAKMKDAGCTVVYVGFESINPQSLKDMNKHQTVEDIKRSIKVFHDNGIMVHGMFIYGSDSDTKEVFKMTSDFCSDTNLDYTQYMILTPLPGTRTYFKLEKEKRLLHKNWDFYDAMHTVFKPKNMTAEELQNGMIESYKKFYSYRSAIKRSLKTAVDGAATTVMNIYKKAHFPSWRPAFMRAAGKGIVKKWLAQNKGYLTYVKKISRFPKLNLNFTP